MQFLHNFCTTACRGPSFSVAGLGAGGTAAQERGDEASLDQVERITIRDDPCPASQTIGKRSVTVGTTSNHDDIFAVVALAGHLFGLAGGSVLAR